MLDFDRLIVEYTLGELIAVLAALVALFLIFLSVVWLLTSFWRR